MRTCHALRQAQRIVLLEDVWQAHVALLVGCEHLMCRPDSILRAVWCQQGGQHILVEHLQPAAEPMWQCRLIGLAAAG